LSKYKWEFKNEKYVIKQRIWNKHHLGRIEKKVRVEEAITNSFHGMNG
jgi:hypothetical protein